MVQSQVTFEQARIGFKNFAGKEGPYNREGDRSFSIFLDEDLAKQMQADGWNIKFPKPRDFGPDEEDNRSPHLPVAVTFDNFPPKCFLIPGEDATPVRLDEFTVGQLDDLRATNVDIIIRPYQWTVNGNSGIKAYLKAIYVTIDPDPFMRKYGF